MKHTRHTFMKTGSGTKIRLTKKRKTIIIAMARVGRTFYADELHDILRQDDLKVAKSTMLRTLADLMSNGLLIRYRGRSRKWKYEKIYNTANGNRLVCVVCGEILEFGNEEIKFETEAICKKYNFKVETISSNIFGVCIYCRYFKPRQN